MHIMRFSRCTTFFAQCAMALVTPYALSATTQNSTTDSSLVVEIPADFQLKTTNNNPSDKLASNAYLEAYIQGAIDTKYPDAGVSVTIRNGSIILSHLSSDDEQNGEIAAYVHALTKKDVVNETRAEQISHQKKAAALSSKETPAREFKSEGIWLPQSTILYPTEVANPRQMCFSIGSRFNDKLSGRWATAVTFGDQFPMYRWTNINGGDLQLELEAGVFAVFNMTKHSYPLINADYYVGVPITYAKGKWAFRLRGHHVSSHVGDEWILDHKHLKRKNKSFEALDFSTAYQITPKLRVYGTVGSVVLSDAEMTIKPMYVQYGAEVRGPRTDFTQLFGQPFFAVHFQNAQDTHFAMDSTYALGYEWGKIQGIGRKVRLFVEYHSGFSPDGQFSRWRTKYLALRLSYGF